MFVNLMAKMMIAPKTKIILRCLYEKRIGRLQLPVRVMTRDVWAKSIICNRSCTGISWEVIAVTLCEELNLVKELAWIAISNFRAILIYSSVPEASTLLGNKFEFPHLGWIDFSKWNPNMLSIGYDRLSRQRWIRIWGLPLNLWTKGIFEAIGNTCGGLKVVDELTLKCDELRWVRLEIACGDIRTIPQLISIIDNGRYFPMAITVKNEFNELDFEISTTADGHNHGYYSPVAPAQSGKKTTTAKANSQFFPAYSQAPNFKFAEKGDRAPVYVPQKRLLVCSFVIGYGHDRKDLRLPPYHAKSVEGKRQGILEIFHLSNRKVGIDVVGNPICPPQQMVKEARGLLS